MMDLMQRFADAAGAGIGKAKYGIVSQVDPFRHAVKVIIQPEGNESGWIPDPGLACGNLRIALPCEVGTQVTLETMEGDSEQLVIQTRLFDASVLPPISPQTQTQAQPGELLVMTGQGSAPPAGSQTGGMPATAFGWFHVTTAGFYAGMGTSTLAIEASAITLTVGTSTFTFTQAMLAALGAGISTDQSVSAAVDVDAGSEPVSLVQHVHTGVESGPDETGMPA